MTASEFRSKHPKIFNQVFHRGASAERIQKLVREMNLNRDPRNPVEVVYGKFEHTHLIEHELPLLS